MFGNFKTLHCTHFLKNYPNFYPWRKYIMENTVFYFRIFLLSGGVQIFRVKNLKFVKLLRFDVEPFKIKT